MGQAEKKARERAAVECLRNIEPHFPAGEFEESERPDFLVRTGEGYLGIEVTEYFRSKLADGTNLQEQDSLRSQIATRATMLCRERTPLGRRMSIRFLHDYNLRTCDVEPIARDLTRLLEKYSSGIVIDSGKELPRGVASVAITCVDHRHHTDVGIVGAVWPSVVDHAKLRKIVDEKSGKLSKYRERCERVWLLIVIDGFSASTAVEVPPDLPQFETEFDRVLLLFEYKQLRTLGERVIK